MLTDALHDYGLRYFPNLAAPTLKTPVVSGTPGTTTYEYQATFTTINGDTTASAIASVATGNATCSTNNKILLQVETVPLGVRFINFFRNTGGTFKYIGQCTAAVNALYDVGQVATSVVPAVTNTSGREDWRFIGYHTDRPLQRLELVDQQAMTSEALAQFGSAYHKDGDIIEGCKPANIFKVSDFCTATVEATGNATLSATNRIKLVVTTIPTGVSSIRFYKLSEGTYQYLGWCKATTNEFYDVGQAFSILPVADVIGESITVPDVITTTVEGTPGTTSYTYKAQFVEDSSLLWNFSAGKVYYEGRHIPVSATSLTLDGTGTEYACITITTDVIDYTDDVKLRNIDDNIPEEMYNLPGADRIVALVGWSVETEVTNNVLVLAEFKDGVITETTITPEYSELYEMIDRRTYDVSGSFTVRPFPLDIDNHDSDDTKLYLRIGAGKAYPNGHEIQIDKTQTVEFSKARATKAVNGSGTDSFNAPGGYVICSNPENYAVDTLKVKLTVGSGNAHIVTLAGNGQTAAQVATQIEAVMNAYATDGDLVECTYAGGYLKIQAIDGKTLTISAVATDAYTILGISTGIYYPIGTRIYQVNDPYVKTVTDMVYRTEIVEEVTHNAQTHIDALGSSTVVDILGASATEADCHDGKWDYEETSDFVKAGNSISFADVQGSEPGSGATYYVKYAYNLSATKGIRELIRVVDAQVVKGDNYTQDKFTFTGGAATKVINDEVVVGLSGNPTDVVRILRINTAPGESVTYYTNYEFLKNSEALILNDSEIDWSAAAAPGSGVTGQPAKAATYYVTYEFWKHSTEGDYVCADSYDMYEELEIAPNETWYLRDCIDFRTEGILPEANQSTVFDYEYYLPRRDKVVLSPNHEFSIIKGGDSIHAPIPPDQPMILSIAVLSIPPYTYSKDAVVITPVDSLRTSQYGIAKLEDRLVRLEHWAAINTLEKEAAGHPTAIDTKGLFTDALTGFDKMSLNFNKGGITHTAALDRYTRALLLPVTTEERELLVNVAESDGIRQIDNTIMLDYQPELIQTQPYASITENCSHDFTFENYYGLMELDPPIDCFVAKDQLPALNVEMDNNWASILEADPTMFNNINWGGWNPVRTVTTGTALVFTQYGYGAPPVGGFVGSSTTTEQRAGEQTFLVPGSRTMNLGNRIVDISIMGRARTTNADGSPFMIKVSITGLMPNIDHACTFGGIPVDFTYDNTPVNHHGSQGSHSYRTKTTVRTSNDGNLTGTFQVPEGISVGKILVRVFYYASPDISTSQSVFYTSGYTATSQGTVIGYDVPLIGPSEVITEERLSDASSFGVQGFAGVDPLAQSFFTDNYLVYISAVGVYFQTKHATQGITCQLRNMINGYPGPYIYASKTLTPAEVSISADSSAETIFTFSHVMGYQANTDYCFVLMPSGNNTGYELYCEEIGQLDYITAQRITTQPASGVMFHGANNTTWEAMSKQDIKYNLYRSNFEENCSIVFDGLTGLEASRFVSLVTEFIYPGTHAIWSYRVALTGNDYEDTWIAYTPNIDVDLGAIMNKIQLRIDVTSLGGNYQIVDKVAGIVFLLHENSANYVGNNNFYSDAMEYPNKIAAFMEIYADGTNGVGDTSVTPKYSVDDGVTFVELGVKTDYIPSITTDPYYRYEFETPDEATVIGATNASVIEIESTNHGFKEGAIVDISGVEGNTNANGTFRIKNVTDDTFELTNPITGVDIAGNSNWTQGGTITLAEFEQMRPLIYLETVNNARTPRTMNLAFICSRI